MQAQTIDVSSF